MKLSTMVNFISVISIIIIDVIINANKNSAVCRV